MKKKYKIFYLLLFFLLLNYFSYRNMLLTNSNFMDLAKAENIVNRNYTFEFFNKRYNFYSNEFIKNLNLSKQQIKIQDDEQIYFNILDRVIKFGLSKREIVEYFFPEVIEIKKILCKNIDIYPEENYVEVEKNSCKLNYIYGEEGQYLNQEQFYDDLYEFVKNNSKKIKLKISVKSYRDTNDIKIDFQEKSSFLTNFSTSSPSRKNNIRVALAKFDGLVLEPGEIFSFNTITGARDEKSGYMQAKIISNGTFVEGYGGGVCQVSTTIYNACLLAGLEILEVHNHSLPVSYVEPSFDAMVNSGSSDLVVRNNTDGKLIITTSSKNDCCKVKIFGKENKYKIVRLSEKIKIIPAENDIIDTNIEKYGHFEIEPGEEYRISYPKDGFYSNGYLKYFDKNGILIETKKIRENKYNPTRGIILKKS